MSLGKEVYEHYQPAGKEEGLFPLVSGRTVLEVGFGSGALLRGLAAKGNEVYGVDAGKDIVENAKAQGFANVFHVDVSEEPLPFADDTFEAVYCYEVFEHLTNPHRAVAEIRRVLRARHQLFFSVPAQEVDMGYGVHRHTFVYPGLLEKANLERFLMQMYFRVEVAFDAGPADWLVGHNYLLTNMKHLGKPDVSEVITQDCSVYDLYREVLPADALRHEVDRELGFYQDMLENCAQERQDEAFECIMKFVRKHYAGEFGFYVELARRLGAAGQLQRAKEVLAEVLQQENLPVPVMEDLKAVAQQIVEAHRPSA